MNWGKSKLSFILLTLIIIFIGCASIPPEAPELSIELGKKISALQESNITLLHRFFDMKRNIVEQFIQEEWVPVFAEEVFSDPQMQETWNTIVSENNPSDRLKFLVIVGPQLQKQINSKRNELINPLNDIEKDIEQNLRFEYSQALAINNSLTSFLHSAVKVQENQQRLLNMIGIEDNQIGESINNIDTVVGNLLSTATTVQDKSEKYIEQIREIKESISSQ